jgi:uncharacterized membrane protein YhaH (DUF805 family)
MEQNQNPQPPVFNQPQAQPQPQPNPQYQPYVAPSPMLEPVEAVKTCFRKFFDFTGRARRSEYWWFYLFTLIVSWCFSFLGIIHPYVSYLGLLVGVVLWIPTYSAMTRRLHDTGHSGWWIVAMFVLLLIVYGCIAAVFMPYASELMGAADNAEMINIMMDALEGAKGGDATTPMLIAVFTGLAMMVIGIIVLVFSIMDSHPGENKYGPSPKYQ